jgi:hypothetical protein
MSEATAMIAPESAALTSSCSTAQAPELGAAAPLASGTGGG